MFIPMTEMLPLLSQVDVIYIGASNELNWMQPASDG